MSLAQIISTYATLNLLGIIAFFSLRIFYWVNAKAGRFSSARTELSLHYSIITALIVLTVLHPILPRNDVLNPAAKIWSAESLKTFSRDYTNADRGGYLMLPAKGARRSLNADKVSSFLLVIAVLVLLFGLLRIGIDIRRLLAIKKHSFPVRKLHRITIFLNDEIQVPFSYWLPFQAAVVMPSHLATKSSDYRMAISHELQHHRQGDTKWVFAMWALRILCFFNPIIHLWSQWLSEIQEFACDETLVDLKKVESQQYARCLIEVAESALHQKHVPACATGLTFLGERNLLQRRIEHMITTTRIRMARSTSLFLGLLIVTLMTGVAYSSKGLVQDRRVTLADAEHMALKIQNESDFPIVVNDLVLTQLNRFIGTPEGREYMKLSIQRMENHKTLIEAKLKEYGVPRELIAIPIIESGYQNLKPNNKQGWGAGVWMFMAQTARLYGLRVDEQADERLNVALETDAAMRLLKADQLRFKDWQLSVLAYNAGEAKVQKGITQTGSRDPWVLIRNGFDNDKDYLPELMAAILIMNNPASVE